MGRLPKFEAIQEEIANMLELAGELQDADGEESRAAAAAMDAYLAELADQEAGKVDGFGGFLKDACGRIKAIREESQRLLKKAQAMERNVAWLKGEYCRIMLCHGVRKIRGNVYTLSLRRSQSVEVEDLEALEAGGPQYIEEIREVRIDRRAIANAISEGREVPGCRLIEKESLQVR